ncbi:resistance to inhibitors of cholinesterase protein 3 isoform X8 [Onthophagus taurus]|uniref:resistance to inhibitors of cholinesterase protein 3 isoform X8 n=1 Tax=Onthophagus taurus TaxID=166361 RepID=UPI000C203229|nr:resistance to inhibitors of cholinesterase protein 3 isoform X9 [Onthophagus taurus]
MDGPTTAEAPRASHPRRAYQTVTDDITPKKSMLVVVIVVGCFAVLWPKVFYPMLVGNANQAIKPNARDKAEDIKQERPPNMRPEIIHPAFRERGSAIPKPQGSAQMQRKHIRTVEGRPGPVPGMRPTMGGPGHVVPPSQKGGSTMGVLMPIYTIGIVIFFTYTLMKLIFKRENTGVRGNLYPPVDPDPRFRREVFENERCKFKPRLSRDPTGRIAECNGGCRRPITDLDQLRNRLQETERAMERVVHQMSRVPLVLQAKTDRNVANGNLMNGTVHKDQEQASVKVLGMETTASCEGGEKWTKPGEPVMSHPVPKIEVAPPQEIYLQGALPAQSQILVTDYATVTQSTTSDTTSDPAVVLAGKMTLSVISMDNVQDQDIETNNGELPESTGEEAVEDAEESKYTTASSATVAEHEVSDEQGTDDEDANDEVERIHDLDLDVNHISTFDEPEEIGQNDENQIDDVIENNFVVVEENNVSKDEVEVEVEEEELDDEEEVEEEIEEEEIADEEIEEEEVEEEEVEEVDEEEGGKEKFEEKLEKEKNVVEEGSEVVEDISLQKNIESEITDKDKSGQQKEQSS